MGQSKNKVIPIVTLSDIFGQDLILNSRPSFSNYGWLPKSQAKLDFLSGAPLTVAGDLPVICSHSVITEEIISLMEKANLEVTNFPQVYRTKEEYWNLLNNLIKHKKKIVFNHVHRPKEVDQKAYWIDPKLIAYLNNKANLHKIVHTGYVPRRITISPSEIKHITCKFTELPLVFKAATNQSSGSGYAVVICKNTTDIDKAYNYLNKCDTVVAEELVDIHKIFNTQFAKTVNGHIHYLGTSDQISSPSGYYLGNWITKTEEPPKSVVELGRSIMEHASRLGFWGIGGFDIALSKDNQVFAIDLNFRLNGSTPALLLRDSIMRIYNASVLLFRTWKTSVDWARFLSICREFIENKYLIPTSIYNPISNPHSNSTVFFSGVIIGSSRQDVLEKECLLAKQGLI